MCKNKVQDSRNEVRNLLSNIEIGAFLNFYNRSGYVLNFSTSSFDAFTMQCIGIPLCEHYQLSKGKSLIAYCSDADYDSVFKLVSDLLDNINESKKIS